eukprot:13752989-Alexandrium_andersonii.AAC.1
MCCAAPVATQRKSAWPICGGRSASTKRCVEPATCWTRAAAWSKRPAPRPISGVPGVTASASWMRLAPRHR